MCVCVCVCERWLQGIAPSVGMSLKRGCGRSSTSSANKRQRKHAIGTVESRKAENEKLLHTHVIPDQPG